MSSHGSADEGHTQANQRSFTQQASTFEDARFNQVLTSESEWVFEALPRGAGDLVLDVAAGTGQAARSLARDVRAVVAVDVTEAMLEVGREEALNAGLGNVVFMLGDAAALPFVSASFDVIVCRYALHHFEDPHVQLAEIARCLRRGGRVGLVDLIAGYDPGVAARQNELERLRDPSHARALSLSELDVALVSHDLEVVSVEERAVRRPLRPWIEQTNTPPEAVKSIAAALTAEMSGNGPVTGFQPAVGDDGELTIVQTLASLVAVAPH